MEVYSFSAKGRRENNEDFILSRQLSPDCSLFLVADGMGGLSYGEIASSLACESISEYLNTNYNRSKTRQLLFQALSFANKNINEKRKELAAKMGTTIAGALIEGNIAFIFWLGDVRIYQIRNNKILFQSEDHSFINEMKKKGNVLVKEIERYESIVNRSLSGVSMEEEPDIIEISLVSNDSLILCSDGFWQKIDVPSISNLPPDAIQKQISTSSEVMDDNYSFLRVII